MDLQNTTASRLPAALDHAVCRHFAKVQLLFRQLLGGMPRKVPCLIQDLRQKGVVVVDGPVIHIPSVENLKNGRLRFGKDESMLQSAR